MGWGDACTPGSSGTFPPAVIAWKGRSGSCRTGNKAAGNLGWECGENRKVLEWREPLVWGGGGEWGEQESVEGTMAGGGGGVKEVVLWTLMGGFMSFAK